MTARTAVVVGNPKPGSRTLEAAVHVARELTGRDADLAVDVAELGARLLDWNDPEVRRLVADVGDADLVVVASPTYKATYTGLLKLFLDRFAGGTGLTGVAVPLMLGAGPTHALAPELILRPLLTELGAVVPVRALYVIDSRHDSPESYDEWLATARPVAPARPDTPASRRSLMTATALVRRPRPADPALRLRGLPERGGRRGGPGTRSADRHRGQLVHLGQHRPPLVSFSVATTSSTWPLLREAAHLGVSVLADHHDAVCRQLAGPTDQRFTGLPFRSTQDGAVLLDEAVATFDCSIQQEVEAGDHVIVVLALHRVTDGGGSSPLVFHRSGFAKLSADDLDQTKLDGRINGKDVDAA